MDALLIVSSVIVLAIPLIAQAIGSLKNVHEIRMNRMQRERELRWRKAEMAKSVLDELWGDPQCRAALTMLDWDGREFDDGKRSTGPITHPVLVAALRIQETQFSADEQFVRDCFDQLFNGISRIEHFICSDLIQLSDVQDRLSYYVGLLGDFRPWIEEFLDTYRYDVAKRYLERFESWNKAPREQKEIKRRGVHEGVITRGGFGRTGQGRSAGG